VEKTRSEAEASGDPPSIAHGVAHDFERCAVSLVLFEIGEKCEIVARPEAPEMRAQIAA
jgi:hypothetical protein